MTIVVVEDEVRIRHGLVNLIQKLSPDYKVVGESENGLEGIKLIRETNPDLVITDVKMPKKNGLDMLEEVHRIGLRPKVVILSSYAEFEYAQRGIRLGVQGYLLKPVAIAALKEMLAEMEGKVGAQEKTEEDSSLSPVVLDMVRTIRKCYGKRLGLDEFAGKYKLSPEYISQLFTRETGVAFSSYLREVRMEAAKDLLLNSELKIYEIAYRVGYPDQTYFSRVFKEYTGVSAKHYAAFKRLDKS